MKKIRRNDLKGLTEMFPVFDRETQQKLRGGYTADEIEDYLNSQLDGLGTGYTDGNGNTHWERNDGSSGNPYTQEQLDNWEEGCWPGGYVEGWGYVMPDVVVYGGYGFC
jgi:hypothetical protein